ncbi:hypothetical protein HGA64_02090 [Candidatus Falkowbacteria bacterium]|nr:hypothetical protein [Candidatus Falkowbacteria bacterium]
MNKYATITKNESQRLMAYRANIAAHSFGHLFEIMSQVIVWSVIYSKATILNGYTFQQMMTYVIVGWFILFATSNYGFEDKVAKDIHQGTLSNFLVKPFSYLRYMTAISIGRISFAMVVVVSLEVILLWFMRANLIFNNSVAHLLIVLLLMFFAYFIRLFFSILVGLASFWFVDISGFYYSFNIISKFLSGAFFPLSLLPAAFVKTSMWFPFAYTFFVPIQLYLGKLTLSQGLQAVAIQLAWLLGLYGIIKIVWYRGLRKYESAGI